MEISDLDLAVSWNRVRKEETATWESAVIVGLPSEPAGKVVPALERGAELI